MKDLFKTHITKKIAIGLAAALAVGIPTVVIVNSQNAKVAEVSSVPSQPKTNKIVKEPENKAEVDEGDNSTTLKQGTQVVANNSGIDAQELEEVKKTVSEQNKQLEKQTKKISKQEKLIEVQDEEIEKHKVAIINDRKYLGIKDGEHEIKENIIGNLADLNTLNKESLVDAINEMCALDLSGFQEKEDSNLTTGSTNVIGSINANYSHIGTLSDLYTAAKSNLVAAINEVNSAVTTNKANIALNTQKIDSNKDQIIANKTNIETNATNIASNKSSIETNATNIASNKSSIETNTTNIASNKSSIETNATNIATNAANIATNKSAIGTLISLKTTEKSNLVGAVNETVDGISTIASVLSESLIPTINNHAAAITTNKTNIETNTTNLASLTSTVEKNTAAIELRFKTSDIVNNLTSTATDKALSAAAGKELKDQLDGVKMEMLNALYPVGCQIVSSTKPTIGTWVEVTDATGRALWLSSGKNWGTTIAESISIANHTLTINEMPSHNHEITDPGHSHTTNFKTTNKSGTDTKTVISSSENRGSVTSTSNNSTTGITINNNGGGAGHNHTASGIKPAAYVIKVWKRTA